MEPPHPPYGCTPRVHIMKWGQQGGKLASSLSQVCTAKCQTTQFTACVTEHALPCWSWNILWVIHEPVMKIDLKLTVATDDCVKVSVILCWLNKFQIVWHWDRFAVLPAKVAWIHTWTTGSCGWNGCYSKNNIAATGVAMTPLRNAMQSLLNILTASSIPRQR